MEIMVLWVLKFEKFVINYWGKNLSKSNECYLMEIVIIIEINNFL